MVDLGGPWIVMLIASGMALSSSSSSFLYQSDLFCSLKSGKSTDLFILPMYCRSMSTMISSVYWAPCCARSHTVNPFGIWHQWWTNGCFLNMILLHNSGAAFMQACPLVWPVLEAHRVRDIQQLQLRPLSPVELQPLLRAPPSLSAASLVTEAPCWASGSCRAASCQRAYPLHSPAINTLPVLGGAAVHLQHFPCKMI